jgi:hypothetical protein
VGFTAGIPKLPLNLPLLKGCQIIGVFWGEFTNRHPAQHAENVAALMALYLDGRIKPRITRWRPPRCHPPRCPQPPLPRDCRRRPTACRAKRNPRPQPMP